MSGLATILFFPAIDDSALLGGVFSRDFYTSDKGASVPIGFGGSPYDRAYGLELFGEEMES